jgi:hypothetical protein
MEGPFIVFCYCEYYPAGGLGDCEGVFRTLDEAKACLAEQAGTDGGEIVVLRDLEWVRVWDHFEGEVREEAERTAPA